MSGLFTAIGGTLENGMSTYVTNVSSALSGVLVPVVTTGVTIWVLAYGLAIVRGEAHESVPAFAWRGLKMATVLAFALGSGLYQQDVVTAVNGATAGLAQTIQNAANTTGGGNPGCGSVSGSSVTAASATGISAIEVSPGNWGISSSMVDALKILGALDESAEEARTQIRAEIASVLVDDGRNVDCDLALALCVRMFDHPYDSVYAEEIHDLDELMQRRLFRRAIQAPDARRSMSLDWLVEKVASFGDPLDVALLQPFTGLPSRINPFPQEEWGAFAAATRFLGRHHGELEPIEAATVEELCLVEVRFLIYSVDAGRDVDVAAVRHAWRRLGEMRTQLVVGCLSEVQSALHDRPYRRDGVESYPPLDLAAVYPDECLAIARRFIDDGALAEFYHQVPDEERGVSFAFEVVGMYGDRSDVDRLRIRSRAHRFARHALSALRRLDGGENHSRSV
ncbi:hypothetical protein WJ23_31535 [Burkholderia lata]|uniref:type IV secretion system protein n=1 Tax=Burkholderia lata (strain ATCC 17760 / DSM 23089 / LMG 22485 / NCIMB 9086 / R18194 / 383) TaxID=482957 RepID=UPI0008422A90|nr:type IV secretion system protein [Burkholderia lata]AOJ42402.1 hypothetical protein WJ23_31535 [Burkholderia lata]